MRKFRVEFAFAENFTQVDEWQTLDGMESVEAESAEEAAKDAAYTDGLENALFRVCAAENPGEFKYFNF